MRLLGQILLACLIFAALQGILAVLAAAAVVLLLWGLLFRTAETAGLLLFVIVLELLSVHPLATLCAGVALAGALLIPRRKRSPPEPPDRPPPVLICRRPDGE